MGVPAQGSYWKTPPEDVERGCVYVSIHKCDMLTLQLQMAPFCAESMY